MNTTYDFLKLAEERYSVRRYSNQPIKQEKMDKILHAGYVAPTACNKQPQRILVVQSEDSKPYPGHSSFRTPEDIVAYI